MLIEMEGANIVPEISDRENCKPVFSKRQNVNIDHREGQLVFDKRRRKEIENTREFICEYFNKKFTFKTLNNWSLCNPDELFISSSWEISELQDMKQQLNNVKNKLNDYDLDEWHRHTRNMNKAGNIQWKLKRDYEPEFVTQAWCKFYETVMNYPLVPFSVFDKGSFNSVHLCEAPGAFVTSLNHYLKTHYRDIEWRWMASTLNPYYEGNTLGYMINDDRFILQTLPNWTFGEDSTGNLMNLNNMLHLAGEVKKIGDISLVTADGSIDCQENPGEQECVVSQLHFCEIVTALHILAEDGNFLLKIFTMYEEQTVCLMYFLCCVFSEVNVFKPATSKEGNSEVYVVCLKYKGRRHLEPWLSKLREHFGPDNPKHVMFPRDKIPQTFIQQLILCAEKFKNFQVNVIENNIQTFEGQINQNFLVKQLKSQAAEYFVDMYRLQKLRDENLEVVGKKRLKDTPTFNLEGRIERGSFNDKCRLKCLTSEEQFIALQAEAEAVILSWSFNDDIKWLEFHHADVSLNLVTGRPIDLVRCSKFCVGSLLCLHNQVQTFSEQTLHSINSNGRNVCENLYCPPAENELINVVKKEYPSIASNMKILNFKEEFRGIASGNSSQKEDVLKIMKTLYSMKDDENLLFLQFSMLTQFNVGVVYLLSHLFQKVGFIRPVKEDFGLIFFGFSSSRITLLKLFKNISQALEDFEVENKKRSILSIIPMNLLCGKHVNSSASTNGELMENSVGEPIFYQCVTEVNNLSVKGHIFERISQLKCVF